MGLTPKGGRKAPTAAGGTHTSQGMRTTSPTPKRFKATQPEIERTRKAVLIRLSPEELAELDAYAAREGLTRSGAVVLSVRRAW